MKKKKTSSRDTARRRRLQALIHYSEGGMPKCSCCQEANIEFLAIDHVEGGGKKHRKKIRKTVIYGWLRQQGYPSGYRVLCHNCNMAYGAYGDCPHQTEARGERSPGFVEPSSLEIRRQRIRGEMLEASSKLISEGFYPDLKSVAVRSGRSPKSLSNIMRYRDDLVVEGLWPCEVLPRGSWRGRAGREGCLVALADGSRKRLRLFRLPE